MRRGGTVRAWQKGYVRPASRGSTRDVEVDFEAEARRFQALAPKLGFCGSCGESVDEERGKLHAVDCPYLPAERRRSA